jgi:7-keto-8-aminopelargonate synthetase-like enzyme
MGKLESHLQWAHREHPDGRVVVVTESVFSMDGDVAPLVDIVAIKQRYGALLLVDEAHALGVFGQGGRGLVEALGLAGRVDIALGTLSKALGTVGGFVVASHSVIELLVNRARSFIYSTALPPAAAAISLAALRHLEGAIGDQRRDRLYRSIARLQMALRPVGSAPPVAPGWSAIFPVILGQATVALESAALLRGRGLLAPAIRYPTVPKNAARLRISLTAEHTDEQLERLLDHLIGPAGVA